MARRYDRFGELSAELFQCESNQQNELEVSAETHILLMRHSGVASRCEIVWSDHGCSKRLSEVRENSILFAPARSRVRVTKKDSGCYGTIVLQIPPCALESLNDEHRDASRVTLAPQAGTGQPELCQVMSAMRDEIERPGPAGQLYKEALALQLLIRLLRSADQLAIAPAKGGLAAWQLRRTIDMLEGDLTSTPSLARLAAQVGLSPTHFCTAFRRSTGLPPHRYLLNRRIEHAKRLMADPERSLTEVALDSGFGSSSQFATAFRRADGRTPSAYRRGL
ncbi:MAG TPA: AraC family transcriptional regulator [Xanthobacteraceae bacterium]|nr:AraC family transcriptional regulator [Xanthobacteraceae bacterium]